MMGDDSDTDQHDDELEITDLRSRHARSLRNGWRRPHSWRDVRAVRWAPLVVSVVVLLVVAFTALPISSDLLGTLGRLVPSPASPTALPALATPTPTSFLVAATAPPLGPAPARCPSGTPPALTHVGPPIFGLAVGHTPVWLAGFTGPYPTLRLGPTASANAWGGWSAPYTQDGWPAPIGLEIPAGFAGQIHLSGWDAHAGPSRSMRFGLIQAGGFGAPVNVETTYTLDPTRSIIPPGGVDSTGAFWYGYAFLPGAGCYTLAASWPGGGWSVMISAGA